MAKGKRAKRLRLLSPNCGGAHSEESSSTTTYEITDQDMANCLILLARGGGGKDSHHHHRHQNSYDHGGGEGGKHNKIEKFVEIAIGTNVTKSDFFIYECKTCNRTFPSFQALGGHRAGHKKPKFLFQEEKKISQQSQRQPQQQSYMLTNDDNFKEVGKLHIKTILPISLQLESQANKSNFNANKAKMHACSICGSEFTSGQALGGHMRRHRAATNTATTQALATVKVEVQHRRKNILELDLNLPAPEEDFGESKFQFPATQKSLVLSASQALVDCHY